MKRGVVLVTGDYESIDVRLINLFRCVDPAWSGYYTVYKKPYLVTYKQFNAKNNLLIRRYFEVLQIPTHKYHEYQFSWNFITNRLEDVKTDQYVNASNTLVCFVKIELLFWQSDFRNLFFSRFSAIILICVMVFFNRFASDKINKSP